MNSLGSSYSVALLLQCGLETHDVSNIRGHERRAIPAVAALGPDKSNRGQPYWSVWQILEAETGPEKGMMVHLQRERQTSANRKKA